MIRRLGGGYPSGEPTPPRPPSRTASVYSSQISSRTAPLEFPILEERDFEQPPPPTNGRPPDGSFISSSSAFYEHSDSGIGSEVKLLEPIQRNEMGKLSANLCRELKTIASLTFDFCRDVVGRIEKPRDLLEELEMKIRPILINLDVETTRQEKLLRANLDNSKISDNRVKWLLEYNKFQLDMRTALDDISGPIYEDLLKVLSLQNRGCSVGVAPKRETERKLTELTTLLTLMDKSIKHERSKCD